MQLKKKKKKGRLLQQRERNNETLTQLQQQGHVLKHCTHRPNFLLMVSSYVNLKAASTF